MKGSSVTVFVVNIGVLCDVIHTQLQTNQAQGMYNIVERRKKFFFNALPTKLYQNKKEAEFLSNLNGSSYNDCVTLRTHFGDNDYYTTTVWKMQLQIRLYSSTYPILHESDHIPFASKQTSQVTFVELFCCRSVTRDWYRNIKPTKS